MYNVHNRQGETIESGQIKIIFYIILGLQALIKIEQQTQTKLFQSNS